MKSIGLFKVISVFFVFFTIVFAIVVFTMLILSHNPDTNTCVVKSPNLLRTLLLAIAIMNIILMIVLFRIWKLSDKAQSTLLTEQKKQFNMMIATKTKEIEYSNEVNIEHEISKATEKILKDLNDIHTVEKFSEKLLINISKVYEIVQGMMFVYNPQNEKYEMASNYAFYSEREINGFKLGEGISGQVAKNKELIILDNIPEDYITIISGLGSSSPRYMCVFPILHGDTTIAVVEVAAFKEFSKEAESVFNKVSQEISEQMAILLN